MAFGGIWQHGKYSYGVWQSFAYNSEIFFKNDRKSRSVNNFLQPLDLDPNRITKRKNHPKLRPAMQFGIQVKNIAGSKLKKRYGVKGDKHSWAKAEETSGGHIMKGSLRPPFTTW